MGASKEHQDLIRVIKAWVESNSPSESFDNRFDLADCQRPSSIFSSDPTVKKSIPDYYGLSSDSKVCFIGEAKTDIPGQSIHDSRADRQIRAFFEYLMRCKFSKTMFLLAVPVSDLSISKHFVARAKEDTGYIGEIRYFSRDGIRN